MKIIGVFGGSGSGKSTSANILGELLDNSYIFHMDDLMHTYIKKHKTEILKDENAEENTEQIISFLSKNNLLKKWIDIIKVDIENETYELIQKLNKEGNTSYLILDWSPLAYTKLYNICDVTIHIICNKDIQLQRLCARLLDDQKLHHWSNEELEKRVNAYATNENEDSSTYCIDNSFDNQALYDKLLQISKDIN